ncbi:MAG: hypothetical protein AAF901_10985, partial [Bacteroidota bacterium]
FICYFIRIIQSKFRYKAINSIYLISNSLIIVMLLFLQNFVNAFSEIPYTIEYPPLSYIEDKDFDGNEFYKFSMGLLYAIVVLVILQLVMTFLIFRFKRHNKTAS